MSAVFPAVTGPASSPSVWPSSPQVRLAGIADFEAAVETLNNAFGDYPFTVWTTDDDDDDQPNRINQVHQFVANWALYTPNVRLLVTDDCKGVAIWCDGPVNFDGSKLAEIKGPVNGHKFLDINKRLEECSPQAPFWTLAILAIHASARHQGLARALIEAGLKIAGAVSRPPHPSSFDLYDQDKLPCQLNTSVPRNVSIYEKFGFKTAHYFEAADGGPPFWVMHRAPAPLQHEGKK